jgi:hypothetical protein
MLDRSALARGALDDLVGFTDAVHRNAGSRTNTPVSIRSTIRLVDKEFLLQAGMLTDSGGR